MAALLLLLVMVAVVMAVVYGGLPMDSGDLFESAHPSWRLTHWAAVCRSVCWPVGRSVGVLVVVSTIRSNGGSDLTISPLDCTADKRAVVTRADKNSASASTTYC